MNENVLKEVDKKLIDYIINNIFPMYRDVDDKSHGLEHIYSVINRSFDLLHNLKLNLNHNIVFTIAAYHDIGRIINDEEHEVVSAQMFLEDEFMKNYYKSDILKLISEAIEDHRASIKYEPRSDYGKLVSSADRNHNIIQPLVRTYQYRLKQSPDSPLENKIRESYEVLKNKFGKNGYAENVWFDDGVYKQYLVDLRLLMENYDEFRKRYIEVNLIDENNLSTLKKTKKDNL